MRQLGTLDRHAEFPLATQARERRMRTALIALILGFGLSSPAYAIGNGLTVEVLASIGQVEQVKKGGKFKYKWARGGCKYEYKADHKGVKEKYKCK